MRLLASLFLVALSGSAATLSFHVAGSDTGGWQAVLSSIGLVPGPGDASVVVMPQGSPLEWTARVEHGTFLILEADSPLAAHFGFRPTDKRVTIHGVEDLRAPTLRIVWEKPLEIPRFEIPQQARVFARERRDGAPLVAGFRSGSGAVLWVAASPGPRGYERFPYLPQALTDLGLEPPFRSARLWAFFDAAYRSRVDLEYFAPRWRQAGISALHIAAWHYWEPDPAADDYLRHLIDACHRNAIQVYAWLELPHVSERFWADHPEWREKTALLQDAQLDWRKLMNLTNRAAFQAAATGLKDLAHRFDWDGINLAELYFESLEGHSNPARFTPMNADVRAEFTRSAGFDPLELFDAKSSRYYAGNPADLARFLEFRAELAQRKQAEWIAQIGQIRGSKPHLDLTLTHVDDRFDPTMRAKIGADVSKTLPLLDHNDFTFLVEDPATIWNLGPERYSQIAARYAAIATRPEKLGIDINIVERYQDVYPTKQQTGTELFALVHTAALAFPRVALYFENSIGAVDLPLLSSAAATVEKAERWRDKLVVDLRRSGGVAWSGPAQVDGRTWPAGSDTALWLTPGRHTIQPGLAPAALRLIDFNGDLKAAAAGSHGVEFIYESGARAMARFDRPVGRIEIDGVPAQAQRTGEVMLLPRGQHFVKAEAQ
jgi:hypothetical protein